jgi:hypothetical protein
MAAAVMPFGRPKRTKSPVDQIHSNKAKSRSAMLDGRSTSKEYNVAKVTRSRTDEEWTVEKRESREIAI